MTWLTPQGRGGCNASHCPRGRPMAGGGNPTADVIKKISRSCFGTHSALPCRCAASSRSDRGSAARRLSAGTR